MAGIPEEKIAEVRSRVDIVQVIGRAVSLKRAGRSYKGLCPFHREKTPSFHVVPDKQIYHCFGCGAGGDVFRFLMEHEGLSFPVAVRSLAEEVGVEIPRHEGPEDARARARREARARLVQANQKAAEIFEAWLWDEAVGAPGRAHLRERGITEATARAFGLGYAPLHNDLLAMLSRAGVSEADQRTIGLRASGRHGDYEWLRGRLTIPIRGPDGKVIAFGARLVEGNHPAKYLNSAESPIYHKSEVLFGLDRARAAIRRAGAAVVVEGYFDVIALHQAGIERAVAACGTALTPAHLQAIARLGADLHLCFDSDAAGSKAVERAHEAVTAVEDLLVRVVSLPEGDDPDAFVRREGAEAFEARCAASPPITEVLLEWRLARVGPSVEERVRSLDTLRSIVGRVRDPLARSLYVTRVADRLRLDESEVRKRLGLGPVPSGRSRAIDGDRGAPVRAAATVSRAPGPEQDLCLLVLEWPHLAKALAPHLDALVHPDARRLVAGILDALEEDIPVQPSALFDRMQDPHLVAGLRGRLAEVASGRTDPLDAEAAEHLFDRLFTRVLLDAIDREEAEITQSAPEGDPVERARRLSELKNRRRQLLGTTEQSP